MCDHTCIMVIISSRVWIDGWVDGCMVITNGKLWINRVWSAEQEKGILPCPRSRLRIWSRETGSAVPSRVSLLILHVQAQSGPYSRDSSRFPRRCRFIDTANRHRVSPEIITSRSCVPMAFTAERSAAKGR